MDLEAASAGKLMLDALDRLFLFARSDEEKTANLRVSGENNGAQKKIFNVGGFARCN
jgi:hypothetical protein